LIIGLSFLLIQFLRQGSLLGMKKNGAPNLTVPVHDYIFNQILDHTIVLGERINESAIAEAINVSRTPVRAALHQLEKEGVVNIYANRYAAVVTFNKADLQDLGILRIALETAAAKMAIFNGSNAEFLKLIEIASKQDAFTTKNIYTFMADVDFHLKIAEISKSQLLIKYFQQLSSRIKVLLAYHNLELTVSVTHRMIAEAMLERNVEKTTKLIAQHLGEFYQVNEILWR